MTILQNLRTARALYAANPSHAPYGDCPARPAVCPIYAIIDASPDNWNLSDAATELFAEATGTSSRSMAPNYIARWNADHTTEEVLAGFDAAIAIAELREQIETAVIPEAVALGV